MENAITFRFQVFDVDQRFGAPARTCFGSCLRCIGYVAQFVAIEMQQIESVIVQPAGAFFAELAPERLEIGNARRAVDHRLPAEDDCRTLRCSAMALNWFVQFNPVREYTVAFISSKWSWARKPSAFIS